MKICEKRKAERDGERENSRKRGKGNGKIEVRLTLTASLTPIQRVKKPSVTRPTFKPSHKPIAAMPLLNESVLRTLSINVVIHPGNATSMPT